MWKEMWSGTSTTPCCIHAFASSRDFSLVILFFCIPHLCVLIESKFYYSGMFGVGGGIVKGPLMLFMGVHPLVASATCAVMIMFTSVAATTMFIAFGTLIWDYGIFLFVIGER